MLQMVSGVLIYFTCCYLLFTASPVGELLPMSSNGYKKGFVQVYLFFLFGERGNFFHIAGEK